MSLRAATSRVLGALGRKWRAAWEVQLDGMRPTYRRDAPEMALGMRLRPEVTALSDRQLQDLRRAGENAQMHIFTFLGSKPVDLHHGLKADGFEGIAYPPASPPTVDAAGAWLTGRVTGPNLSRSRKIWGLVSQGEYGLPQYRPIDWHIDFKSGYRWPETMHWRRIQIGPALGADIKMPWEMARMPFLPQLALYSAACAARGDHTASHRAAAEVRAIMLDFVATNPPRFGVNWRSPMEVGIRIANLLMAFEILAGAGHVFEPEVNEILRQTAVDHGRHVLANLEWSEEHRGNHYLANLCGVIFVAGLLTASPETDAWLFFARAQLDVEIPRQFLGDGGSFEHSTSYHRLSGEMVFWALALLVGLPPARRAACRTYNPRLLRVRPPKPTPTSTEFNMPISGEALLRLARLAEFSRDCRKPNGRVTQIGDNDSGRLFRFDPLLDSDGITTRDTLDHSGLLALAAEILGRPDLAPPEAQAETIVVRSLLAGRVIDLPHSAAPALHHVAADQLLSQHLQRTAMFPESHRHEYYFPISSPISWLESAAYPQFGTYILRGEGFFLAIRCAAFQATESHGHSHDDNLTVELMVDGKELISDPGTYVYTADAAARRLYRSAGAHFVPRCHGLPVTVEMDNLFEFFHVSSAHCLYFGYAGFLGVLSGGGQSVHRAVAIEAGGIRIVDTSDKAPLLSPPLLNLPVCQGYGQKTLRPSRSF